MATERLVAIGFNGDVSDDFELWAGSDRLSAIDPDTASEATGIQVPQGIASPQSSQMLLSNPSAIDPADTINSVTPFIRAVGLEGSSPCNFYMIARIWDGSWNDHLSVKQSFTDTISSYSEAFPNPLGGAWDLAALTDLEYRVRLTNDRGLRIFWAGVDIDYTPSGGGGGGPGPWIDDGCQSSAMPSRVISGLTNDELYEFEIKTKDMTGNVSTGVIVEATPNPAEASPAPVPVKIARRGIHFSPRHFHGRKF